jgi:tetratricopeptide (TPR) repeat protein
MNAKKLLFILALQPEAVSRAALKEIGSMEDNDSFENRVSELLQLSLIEHEHDTDYFSILPLTRRFIRSQFSSNRKFIKQAELKTAQYYVNLLSEKSSFKEWRGYDELLMDRNNILSVAQWCYKSVQKKQASTGTLTKPSRGIAEILVQIGNTFGSVLWQRAYWYDRMTLAHAALHAAKMIPDWKAVSTFARNIGWIYFYQGDYLRASYWAEEALSATTKTEDRMLIAAAKRSLGTVKLRLGDYKRSEELLLDVLKTSEEFPDDDYGIYSKGFAQYGMGDLEYERGHMQKARQWYQQALDTWQDPLRKDPIRHISLALNGLGFVALQEKKHEEAQNYFLESTQSAEEFGRIEELAKGQLGLAAVHLETNRDLKTGLILVIEATETFHQLGMQYELRKSQQLREQIMKANPQVLTSD